ncbi:tRNA:m(4)X modification enzyme [Ranunculus cassubicifolius]
MAAPSDSSQRCKYWLPRKNRFCANSPINHSPFCGNHNPNLEQQGVPCPLDPSHTVSKEKIEKHIKICPFLKQAETLRFQPFYNKGINGGTDEEDHQEAGNIVFSDTVTSHMKRNAVHKMNAADFRGLINKIRSIHAEICRDIQDSFKSSEACTRWLKKEVDGKLPFQEKHVLQQAAILGNLEEFGILPDSSKEELNGSESSMDVGDIPAVVEFGAGRGYLTQMLADCYGIRKVFLVERRSYKLKADRSLRKKESLILERLRIDIEDLDLNGVEALKRVPYLATGKHLCGPATDLTLRCCLRDNQVVASDNHLRGLAIATCCHHLCQWKHYVNKNYMSDMGITKDTFHAITWFTSWAVDATHSAADVDDNMVDQGSHIDSIQMKDEDSVRGVESIVKGMAPGERAAVGFMCKDIIDMGRLMWIKKHGLGSRLVKYVPASISPENRLLIAKYSIHS